MHLNFFAISGLLVAFTSSILMVILLVYGRNRLQRLWAFFNCFVVLWGFSLFKIGTLINENESLFWWKIASAAGGILAPLFLHIVSKFGGLERKRLVIGAYSQIFIFILLDFGNLATYRLRLIFNSFYYLSPTGFILPLFLIFWAIIVLYSIYLLSRFYRYSQGIKRIQVLYIIIGILFGFVGGGTHLLTVFAPTLFNIDIYPFGQLGIAIYAIIVTYAILRYRLLDIKIAITRAGIFLLVYTLVLGIPFWIGFKYDLWKYSTWIMLFLATLGPFIYTALRRRSEDVLLKDQRRYQDTLKQASAGMTRIRNLSRLLNLIAHILTRTVKISYIGIYLYREETDEYILEVCRDKGRRHLEKFPKDNPLIAWIILHKKPLLYEEIRRLKEETNDATHIHLEENMRSLCANVVIPCLLQDRIIGFFALGEKLSGQIYTPEDLNVFQILASQAALSIENARFFEEAKKMQEQIAQAEKMATIGTMADGLSHQINNRFHALSLIAADTIDTIKMTDTSNCSAEIKEAFNQISHALERVRTNVMQGGEVVRGMLKYTRKGEEGFEPLTLDQILDSTLEMVQYKVKLSEIDIIRNYPKDSPKIRGNSVQLQEAFFNFIDNGYDSTVERKTILKEANYRGRITFSALSQQENGMLLVTIEDNGMGIKDQDTKKLFTPFFTTKVSSRQGTGLGLYVLRRVIEEFHKGKIWFASEYGKGTRFFLQLPIAKE